MNADTDSEAGSELSGGKGDPPFLGSLRKAVNIALVVGLVGSVALLLYAGRRNPSFLVRVIFVGWVSSPFIVLLLANRTSRAWSAATRVAGFVVVPPLPISPT